MCLINFAFQHHPSYPLILVGNRDEFYERPTQALHWWEETDNFILAGKDLQEGGTWMGINKAGQFGALTNFRDLNNIKPSAPSRGQLVKNWLSGDIPLEEMHRLLKTQGNSYNGFNLIYGNMQELFYYSNETDIIRQLYPGIYGISNALLDTPWPKVKNSKAAFVKAIDNSLNSDAIIEILSDRKFAPIAELPHTGVSPEWEEKLSAMFITSEKYGTRLTTFVQVNTIGDVIYREKSYHPKHDKTISFTLTHNQ